MVATFGFSKTITLLLTAPPYLVTTVLSIVISRMSDRKPERCLHLAVPLAVGMIGFIISAATTKTAPRYFSLFLMLGGLFGSYNVALAWISSCFPRPRAKRASAYAIINSLGNIAQIWSPYLYPKSDGPKYTVSRHQTRFAARARDCIRESSSMLAVRARVYRSVATETAGLLRT